MDTKVVKFGGSSLADAGQFKKVADIVLADPARRFVVASAPGKRFSGDIKVTDMLYGCYDLAVKGESFDKEFAAIEERLNGIISELGIDLSLETEFANIKNAFAHRAGRDYAASRGEYLNSIVLAKYLGYDFVDPAGYIRFDEKGSFDLETTSLLPLSTPLSPVSTAQCPMIPSRPSPEAAPMLQVLSLQMLSTLFFMRTGLT